MSHFHKKTISELSALLQSGEPGNTPWKYFTGIGNVASQGLNVCTRELKRVLVALFLSCHKRHKQGILNLHGKKKKTGFGGIYPGDKVGDSVLSLRDPFANVHLY